MKIIYFLALFSMCFANDLNYAPKIENPKSEKPLVLLVCSYNNEKYYKGNLDSIFSQEYENYRVIYVNDASTDNTGELVKKYIADHGVQDRVTYVENRINRKAMFNIYHGVHICKNSEVVLLVDGDDRLFGTKALKRINQAFSDDNVWFTCGQYKGDDGDVGSGQVGCCIPSSKKTLRKGKHRELSYRWSHIRTFYAGLFKLIPKHRLMYKRKFIDCGWDIPIVLNLIDLARDHTYFIPEIIYLYNWDNPISDMYIRRASQAFFCKYCYKQKPLSFFCRRRADFL